MLNGVTEEHQVHGHDTGCAVVLIQHVQHVFLQHPHVCDVLVHVLRVDVVP